MSVARALALYAQILGKKFGINVVFGDVKTAATDGKTVYVDTAYNGVGTERQAQTLFGLVAHEAMHIRLTDFDAIKTAEAECLKERTNWGLLKHIHNVIEDMWGERVFCGFYPSVWQDIVDSMVVMREDGLYGPPKMPAAGQQQGAPQVFLNWWLAENIGQHYGLPTFRQDALAWREQCVAILGQNLVGQGLQLLTRLKSVESTAQAFVLAKQVYALIRDQAECKEADSSSSGASGKAQAAQQLLNADVKVLNGIKTEKGDMLSTQKPGNGNMPAGSPFSPLESPPTMLPPTSAFLRQVGELRTALSGRLERLLHANAHVDTEYVRSGAKIVGGRLALVKTGRLDVFERTELGEDLDTVVDIAVDGSGSMGMVWLQTLAAGYAVADILSGYHVPFGLLQFASQVSRVHPIGKKWGRHSQMVPDILRGGTSTARALNECASGLFNQNFSRRVLLLITDGEPSDRVAALSVASEAQRAGIDVAHILIGVQGAEYEKALRASKIGAVSRCQDESDSIALAKAIEEVMANSFSKHLRKAA